MDRIGRPTAACAYWRLALSLLLCVLLSEWAPPTYAASSALPSPDRPRTCLVLGGGGARGAAHIGV
ncbi:MAG: hypothetical protein ACN6PO_13580, partial [Stenotrophomonas bentonitica]